VAGDAAGIVEEARVEGRLAAAGLTLGVDDPDPELAQDAHHAHAHLGVYEVDVAWYE
jgi:hypothetical protein